MRAPASASAVIDKAPVQQTAPDIWFLWGTLRPCRNDYIGP